MNEILIVGNPNAGKTTFINSLCKSNDKVGNWHGVTVKEAVHKAVIDGTEQTVVDLPGLYSLSACSPEERLAKKYIENNLDKTIINIIDANYLERSLVLTFELLEISRNVVVAVNMASEVSDFDYEKLEKILGVSVFEIDARSKRDVLDFVKKALLTVPKNKEKTALNRLGNSVQNAQNAIKLCKKDVKNNKKTTNIDKILLNKYAFLPIFVICVLAVFFVAFGPIGLFLSDILQKCVGFVFDFVFGKIFSHKIVLYEFLSGGVFGAIKSVISFVPQIVLLNFCIGVLENCGYLPRVGYMFNFLLSKIGLSGKSTLPLLLGLGCSASAVTFTKSIENKSVQKKSAILLGFVPCSAKLPFVLCIVSAFFAEYKFLFVLVFYLLSILIGVVALKLHQMLTKNKQKQSDNYFLLEIPKMRVPSFLLLLKLSLKSAIDFVARILGTVTIGSILIYLLSAFNFKFAHVGMLGDGNMLTEVSNFLFPVMKIFGLSSTYEIVVLLSGLFGKEMIVATIGELNKVGSLNVTIGESLTIASSPICFLSTKSVIVFSCLVMLYPTCIAAFAGFKAEFGSKFAVFAFFVNLTISLAFAFLINVLWSNCVFLLVFLFCFLFAIILFVVLKYKKKNECKGNCYDCNKLCW